MIGMEQDVAATRHVIHGTISTTERRKQFQTLKAPRDTSGLGYATAPHASSPQLAVVPNSDMDATTTAYHAMASSNHSTSHLL